MRRGEMIPLQRPSFGIGTILVSAVRTPETRSVRAIEEAYADYMGCPSAVWLPSARAGISWALRAGMSEPIKVLTPAFTCSAAHEAVVRSGGTTELIDAAEDDFLMDEAVLCAGQRGRHALVLCELYGHTYDLRRIEQQAQLAARVRVIDMAMSVPHPGLAERLGANDFGVISFGAGKTMYSGWGAIGFGRDAGLIVEVKKIRDSFVTGASPSLGLRRTTEALGRTAGQHPAIFSFANM